MFNSQKVYPANFPPRTKLAEEANEHNAARALYPYQQHISELIQQGKSRITTDYNSSAPRNNLISHFFSHHLAESLENLTHGSLGKGQLRIAYSARLRSDILFNRGRGSARIVKDLLYLFTGRLKI